MNDDKTIKVSVPGYDEYMIHVGKIQVAFEALVENIDNSIAVLLNPGNVNATLLAARALRRVPQKLNLLKSLCTDEWSDLPVEKMITIINKAKNIRVETAHSSVAFSYADEETPVVITRKGSDPSKFQEFTIEELNKRIRLVESARQQMLLFLFSITQRLREKEGKD